MSASVRTPNPTVILYGSNTSLACGLNGEIRAEEMQGLFAADTRVLSTYKLEINGNAWRLLGRSITGHGTGHWEYQNPRLRDPIGDIPEATVSLALRRRVDGALHEDLSMRSYAPRTLRLRLTLQLDADFADIFEVKSASLPPRMNMRRIASERGTSFVYERGGFQRALHVELSPSGAMPTFTGSRITFEIELESKARWSCCLEAVPEAQGRMIRFAGDPHAPEPDPVSGMSCVSLRADPILAQPFERGQADLHALALPQPSAPPFIAAGAPWFMTLFGRDSLMTALMAGIDGSWPARGALAALGRHQGMRCDSFRDEEPGKIPHELRQNELTQRGDLPYSPYYGTHDAASLYCLALWNAWRWTGERELLEAHLDTARDAMRWCETYGDADQDGLQEYRSRSRKGYRNQGWKDAGDAVVDAEGRQAELPIATVELQGYLFAARLAMVELLSAQGHDAEARRMREAAARIQTVVEERFWMERQQFYAFALDGRKRAVDAVSSNPGHLLWSGLPDREHAAAVARRLMQPDMFSGWGLRTLSADSPAYNPLSYQLGSVWPHDTALAAAGMWRYGFRAEASRLLHAVLTAACAFEEHRLPELFCGFEDACGFPVPYEKANVPQAWAAAVPLLAAQLFLGLVPDAPHGRCYVDPWLPEWLPRLEMRHIPIGEGSLDIAVTQDQGRTRIERLESDAVEATVGEVEAPLWGVPPKALLSAAAC